MRLDEGFGDLSSRDSYAGLEGGFDNVRLGRTIGPVYYATYDYISMHNHDTGTSSDALLAGAIFGNEGFMNNTVWYTSPKFGGFTVDLAHSLLGVERLPGESQPSYFGIVGSYDTGPLHVAVSHAETKNSTDLDPGAGVSSNKDRATTIGGLYNLKFVVLGALYEKAKSATFGTGDVSRDYFRVSAMVPVGQHEFHANFGTVDHRLDVRAEDDGAKQWNPRLQLQHHQTTVDNDTNGTYGASNFPTVTQVPGLNISSIALGVRHNF